MCRHQWEETRRRFLKPVEFEAKRLSPELARELIWGVTTVDLRCSKCGDVDSRKLPGDAR